MPRRKRTWSIHDGTGEDSTHDYIEYADNFCSNCKAFLENPTKRIRDLTLKFAEKLIPEESRRTEEFRQKLAAFTMAVKLEPIDRGDQNRTDSFQWLKKCEVLAARFLGLAEDHWRARIQPKIR
jgi:hypothetical protein